MQSHSSDRADLERQLAELEQADQQAFLDAYHALTKEHGYQFVPVAHPAVVQNGQVVVAATVEIVPFIDEESDDANV